MRQFLTMLLVVCVLLGCTACQTQTQQPLHTVKVYYKAATIQYGTAEGVIVPYALDATGHEDDTLYLLKTYVSGSVSEGYAVTFPPQTEVVSLELDGLTAKIILNDVFATLTGLDLSIACACLTQTVISLTGCQEVIISAENTQLDGRNFITLTKDSYLLLDESGST